MLNLFIHLLYILLHAYIFRGSRAQNQPYLAIFSKFFISASPPHPFITDPGISMIEVGLVGAVIMLVLIGVGVACCLCGEKRGQERTRRESNRREHFQVLISELKNQENENEIELNIK
jgi:hypothetical protein